MNYDSQRRQAPDLEGPSLAGSSRGAMHQQLRMMGDYATQAEALRPSAKNGHGTPAGAMHYTHGQQPGTSPQAAKRARRNKRIFTARMTGGSPILESFQPKASKRFPNMRLVDGTDRARAAIEEEIKMAERGRTDPRTAIDGKAARAAQQRPVDVTIHMQVVQRGHQQLHIATITGPEGQRRVTIDAAKLEPGPRGFDGAIDRIVEAIDQVQ